jgi:cytochrome c oxidase subunit III
MADMAHAAAEGAAARRPPVPALLFATILFLASELLFFGGLFAAYFNLRADTSPWPPEGVELEVVAATIGTLLLVASSVTFQAGIVAGGRSRLRAMRGWTVVTIVLGSAFLGIQLFDWLHLDFGVSSHAYGTMFYAMTGFHGLHVLAGLLLMLVVLGRAAQGAYRDGNVVGADAVAYYWHLVDAVWIALYSAIFLLR